MAAALVGGFFLTIVHLHIRGLQNKAEIRVLMSDTGQSQRQAPI